MRWSEILKESKDSVLLKLKSYFDDNHLISFTSEDKLGINPESVFNTPIGVYFYPLGSEVIQDQLVSNTLPFATKNPYIKLAEIVSDKSQVLIISEMSQQDAASKALDIWNVVCQNYGINPSEVDALRRKTFRMVSAVSRKKDPGSIFWTFSLLSAAVLKAGGADASNIYDMYYGAGYYMVYQDEDSRKNTPDSIIIVMENDSYPTMWSKLLRTVGIKVVIDKGLGIIHPNEPTQAVALEMSAIKLVQTFDNPYSTKNVKGERNIKSEADLYEVLTNLDSKEFNWLHAKFCFENRVKLTFDTGETTITVPRAVKFSLQKAVDICNERLGLDTMSHDELVVFYATKSASWFFDDDYTKKVRDAVIKWMWSDKICGQLNSVRQAIKVLQNTKYGSSCNRGLYINHYMNSFVKKFSPPGTDISPEPEDPAELLAFFTKHSLTTFLERAREFLKGNTPWGFTLNHLRPAARGIPDMDNVVLSYLQKNLKPDEYAKVHKHLVS